MKKLNLIFVITLLAFLSACNVFSTSEQGKPFDYEFETDKSTYSSQESISASFKNESSQTLFLNYQICTITDMQMLENDKWKSIPIPVFCTGEVKAPVKVEPGEKLEVGVNLEYFGKNELVSGTYRLDMEASYENGNQQEELVSNNFKIRN